MVALVKALRRRRPKGGQLSLRALQALRGLALVAAATLVAELGDITRFANPRQFMAYLGLVPSEHSSGSTQSRAPRSRILMGWVWNPHRRPQAESLPDNLRGQIRDGALSHARWCCSGVGWRCLV